MKPKPSDSSRPKIFQSPAAAAAAASVTAAYALTKAEKLYFTKAEDSNSKGAGNILSEQNVRNDIKAIREEKNVLELSLEEVRAENNRIRGQIDEKNGSHSELSKVCFFYGILLIEVIANWLAVKTSWFQPYSFRNSFRSKANL